MMMSSKTSLDKFACTIMAAFMFITSVHISCRYNLDAVLDRFFEPVSAETVLTNPPQQAPVSAAPATAPITAVEASPVGVMGDRPIARNPFLVPAAARPRIMVSSGNAKAGNAPVADGTKPQLKGIISSGGRSMAIIEYRGTSNAYTAGQSIGGYTLNSIGGSSVSLSGDESVSLRIGGK